MELILKLPPINRLPSGARARWVATLNHEPWYQSMENSIIIVAIESELNKILTSKRGLVCPQLNLKFTAACDHDHFCCCCWLVPGCRRVIIHYQNYYKVGINQFQLLGGGFWPMNLRSFLYIYIYFYLTVCPSSNLQFSLCRTSLRPSTKLCKLSQQSAKYSNPRLVQIFSISFKFISLDYFFPLISCILSSALSLRLASYFSKFVSFSQASFFSLSASMSCAIVVCLSLCMWLQREAYLDMFDIL